MKLPTELRRALHDSIRMYFAPLTGAIKVIRAELRRVDREIRSSRDTESRAKKDAAPPA